MRAAFLLLLFALVAGPVPAQQQRPDADIQKELAPRLPAGITMQVKSGVVTLAGTVPTLATKTSALLTTRRTIGVREIVDHIRVVPKEPHTDKDITSAVTRAISGNLSSTDAAAVHVSTTKGVVTLTGTLATSYPKEVAGVLASWIPGVVDVQNEIQVKPSEVRSDEQILTDIGTRFQKNPFVHSQDIFVTVNQGVVTLTGIVSSVLASDQAEAIARFTPGVVDVRNTLFVRFTTTGTL